jgi:hypothetical protein
MSAILKRIKRLILTGRYIFTEKATIERERDQLSAEDILEAIMNAQDIYKTINSRSPYRQGRREKLYVILSFTYDGILIYTKGKIAKDRDGLDKFYVLISSKRAIRQ